ncbi:MAG: type II toxin-antitoxin system RelE/ParE family toxin [Chitinivibrionales bacterium]|nr:type II toxin-antitoxin system RelE/ParE family toxin [Chitinivibrionales bacterium]
MSYAVHIVADAERDILDIYRYVRNAASKRKADELLAKLEAACESLDVAPERGHIPPELRPVGVVEYREIHYKPYRIIYQTVGKRVYVHCVLDGRRELQELLEERLLR